MIGIFKENPCDFKNDTKMKSFFNILALTLLGFMFLIMLFSSWNDSATYDESAHIPAGYSYLALKDCRLGPEHPPLIKDLSALPLIFLNLEFPIESKAWKENYILSNYIHVGRIFLFESGNDADQIIFWARLPIIFLAIFFGWFLFKAVRSLYGCEVALLTLFFFATSTTIIAHSRYVTTDLGAAFGFFIGIITFYKFLEKMGTKSLILAGISLGGALLMKFSLFLLIPLYVIFGFLWVFLTHFDHLRGFYPFKTRFMYFIKEAGKMALRLFLIFFVAFLIVLIFYQYHVWNYPQKRQVRDTEVILTTSSRFLKPVAKPVIWMADKPVLRSFGQYFLGLLMTSRTAASIRMNLYPFYWGKVSNAGWKSYFPVAYLLKEQLAFHILTLFVLIITINSCLKKQKNLDYYIKWFRDNFILTMSFIFIGIYWFISILSPLNIGVRHILPTFPFIYLLVAYFSVLWLRAYPYPTLQNYKERLIKSILKYLFPGMMLVWLLVEIVLAFPFYLSYYNILAGGTPWGWRYIVDSNYDWGQDLKRLKKFVEERKIDEIKLDYFGSASPYYHLGEKFKPWNSSKGKPQGWFAISATIRQSAWGKPVESSLKMKIEDTYSWLKPYQPVARVGTSIFIYYFD